MPTLLSLSGRQASRDDTGGPLKQRVTLVDFVQ
ncbi:hypothetical protein EES40_35810 [Streptomyces sp. ADI93-02]|nr:hypothetical protein EES40_35810 [Streptomyces sp. ADI93-02]